MTTEDDFQAKLDADPEDWQTRLVLADWLEERGDPRAEGYRALGIWKRCPRRIVVRRQTRWHFNFNSDRNWLGYITGTILCDGYTQGAHCLCESWIKKVVHPYRFAEDFHRPTRRAAEDAAALAFARLPAARRAELLNPSTASV